MTWRKKNPEPKRFRANPPKEEGGGDICIN